MIKKSNSFNSNTNLVINKVLEYDKVVAYTVFDTESGVFKEIKSIENHNLVNKRDLPELNGNSVQRFENNNDLVKRLGPGIVKELICSDVSYEDIYKAIDKVYEESL